MTAIDDYVRKNADYAAGFAKKDLSALPTKHVTVITCMDARLRVGHLLGLENGEAHVIRNAGGIVTEDVIRSLAFSQNLLGTREVMVIHHTDCGLLIGCDEKIKDAIQEQTGARPHFEMGAFESLEDEVRESIAAIRNCPYVKHVDQVRGFVYETETGRLREVG